MWKASTNRWMPATLLGALSPAAARESQRGLEISFRFGGGSSTLPDGRMRRL